MEKMTPRFEEPKTDEMAPGMRENMPEERERGSASLLINRPPSTPVAKVIRVEGGKEKLWKNAPPAERPLMTPKMTSGTIEVARGQITRVETVQKMRQRTRELSDPTPASAIKPNAIRPTALEQLYAATMAEDVVLERPRAFSA
jgi:hypothetical protein